MEEQEQIHNRLGLEQTICGLTPADAEAFREIRLRSLREHPDAFGADAEESEERLKDSSALASRLQSTPEQFILGAFAGKSALVGLAGFYRQEGKKIRHKGMLWGMYVAPEDRGHALGRRLLEAVLDRARRLPGLEQAHLCAVVGNHSAKRLYEAAGFTVFGRERGAIKLGDRYLDEEHMRLRL